MPPYRCQVTYLPLFPPGFLRYWDFYAVFFQDPGTQLQTAHHWLGPSSLLHSQSLHLLTSCVTWGKSPSLSLSFLTNKIGIKIVPNAWGSFAMK